MNNDHSENTGCLIFSIHYTSINNLPLRGVHGHAYLVNFTDRIVKFKWNGREYVTSK